MSQLVSVNRLIPQIASVMRQYNFMLSRGQLCPVTGKEVSINDDGVILAFYTISAT